MWWSGSWEKCRINVYRFKLNYHLTTENMQHSIWKWWMLIVDFGSTIESNGINRQNAAGMQLSRGTWGIAVRCINVKIHWKTHMWNEDSIGTYRLVMWKSKSMHTVRSNWKMNEQNCLFKLSRGTTQLCMITLERNTNWNGRAVYASQMVWSEQVHACECV